MQSFAAILSTVALALSISSVSSSPIKRSDDVTCKFQTEGFLTVLNYIPDGPSDPSHMNGNDTLVYLTKDNKLTIKPKEDEKLSQFDFYSCQSKFEKYQTQEKPLKDGDFNPDTSKSDSNHLSSLQNLCTPPKLLLTRMQPRILSSSF